MACSMSGATAKIPTLATAKANVRTVKKVRALRRVRSVSDLRTTAERMIARSSSDDDAVADRDHAIGPGRELEIVRHVHHGPTFGVEGAEDLEHLGRSLRVQVAGGSSPMISSGSVRERAGDGDPLLLSAGELGRQVVGLLTETDDREVAPGLLGSLARGAAAREVHGQHRVLEGGQRR
jgi:hypothetical protein